MTALVFDLETIPDAAGFRRLHAPAFDDLDDAACIAALSQQLRSERGSDFPPHYLHRIVAIAVLLEHENQVKCWSLGEEDSSEAELIERFFKIIQHYQPTLVSWNGGGFDLPVLHHRAMIYAVAAPEYWDVGQWCRDRKYNHYLGRFHWRHIDLMDVLAAYQNRAFAPLDAMAKLCGFPGKLPMEGVSKTSFSHAGDDENAAPNMDGSAVLATYQRGEIGAIRRYCESDVFNTYLLYLRFQQLRGELSAEGYAEKCRLVQQELQREDDPVRQAFLKVWQNVSFPETPPSA